MDTSLLRNIHMITVHQSSSHPHNSYKIMDRGSTTCSRSQKRSHCVDLSRTLRVVVSVSEILPGALVAPGASKPSKLLLQYSVELSFRVDGHGGSGGRRSQARRRGGSRGKQFSSATGGERRQSLHVLGVYLGLLHLGERLPSLTCGRGGERGKKGGSPEDGSARARKGAQGRYRVISKCGSYRVRLKVGQYPRSSEYLI